MEEVSDGLRTTSTHRKSNYNRGTTEIVDSVHADRLPAESPAVNADKEKDLPAVAVHDAPASLHGTPHTLVQRMRMFDKRWTSMGQLWVSMYRPVLLLRFPCVFWWAPARIKADQKGRIRIRRRARMVQCVERHRLAHFLLAAIQLYLGLCRFDLYRASDRCILLVSALIDNAYLF